VAQSLQLTLSARSASRPTLNTDVTVLHPRTGYRLLVGLCLVDISTVIQKLTIASAIFKQVERSQAICPLRSQLAPSTNKWFYKTAR